MRGTLPWTIAIALLGASWPARAHAGGGRGTTAGKAKQRHARVVRKRGERDLKRYFRGWRPRRLRAEWPARPSGAIEVENVHTGEVVHTHIYNPDGTYDASALAELDRLWRCRHTDTTVPIDPHLYEILSHVYDRFGRRILLYSGHREQLNTDSYHYKGTAADLRVHGVELRRLQRFVESLDAGGLGVGLYPRSHFVHVDVRPWPGYRWIDRSPPGSSRRVYRRPES